MRTVDLVKETQQRDPSDEIAVSAQMPEAFSCEPACINNTNGKCVGMLTIERLQTLLEAYEAAKRAGMHTTIQPPVQDTATEIMGLLSRQKAQEKQLSAKSKKAHNFNALITPPCIRSALRKWCMVSTERFFNPLKFDCTSGTVGVVASAQATETRSLGRALMPFLYAIVATPSATLLMMTRSCSNSYATQ
eukprot:944422-Pelagomonas_calceolata.AAC.1